MPHAAANSRLGETLRMLMARRGLTGLEVSTAAAMSPAAFSRILTGKVRPRQGTLTKLFSILCKTPQEEQSLLSSYSGIPELVSEEQPSTFSSLGAVAQPELDRVARYLELKTLSIDFRESVHRVLSEAGISFESYARSGNVVTDFLISGRSRIALECKFNVNRDWEREACTAHLLRTHLPCESVIVVVPYLNDLATQFATSLSQFGARVVSISDLPHALAGKGAA